MKHELNPIAWKNDTLFLLDQRLLPHQQRYIPHSTHEHCYTAIRDMAVRGAPLIGFTAAWGMALWLKNHKHGLLDDFMRTGRYLKSARPTAVNLAYEIDRITMLASTYWKANNTLTGLYPQVVKHVESAMAVLALHNQTMAELAVKDLLTRCGDRQLSILTICNTGVLACGCKGTALGIIEELHKQAKLHRVFASETRPWLQGSRLTAWELQTSGIAYEIVTEGAAAYLFSNKLVDAFIAGADRIAANGDTANKIGTAGIAIIARYYQVPVYIAAPLSTFHPETASGREITIELRDEEEILSWQHKRIAPNHAHALNPAFDITENANITAIACEKGIITPVNNQTIQAVMKGF